MNDSLNIKKAVVLGAGTMGAQAAAHIAAQGIDVVLLDIPAKEGPDRSAPAKRGREMLKKLKPSPLHLAQDADRLRIGNFDDNWNELQDADWVFEAVIENLAIKQNLWGRVVGHVKPTVVLSTNTSGLGIDAMSAKLPLEVRRRFLGTHFFNPPRYLKLLETIPCSDTDPALLIAMERFCETVLGKGVVRCKDTPDFIGNRIGMHAMAVAIHTMRDLNMTIEEVDALTGQLIGRPRSATFRTADVVGVDVANAVAMTVYEHCPNDPERQVFRLPDFVRTMVERKILGEKTGGGFYKRDGKTIYTLDWKTLDYRDRIEPDFLALKAVKGDIAARLAAVFAGGGKAADFLLRALCQSCVYAASLIPEIADDIVSVDRALEWGYGWSDGPFKLIDAVGPQRVAEWARANGRTVPPILEALLRSGRRGFYQTEDRHTSVFLSVDRIAPLPKREGVLDLVAIKAAGAVRHENKSASLVDLGDGVALIEFHTKMNALDDGIFEVIEQALARAGADYDALVVGNQGQAFSAGANLMMILGGAREKKWEILDRAIRRLQGANMALKYGAVPTVAAPFGLTLGGGCEIALHSSRVRLAAETYMGLVEVGVGLVPAGGGTKEMALRAHAHCAGLPYVEPLGFLRRAFETIAYAKTSASGAEAKELFLTRADSISANGDRLLADAKEVALALVRTGYRTGTPRRDVPIVGRPALATFKSMLHNLGRGGMVSEHDALIATHVATILCGGDRAPGFGSEEHYLDLEREAFLSLVGTEKTQARIEHMLKQGKPLRN